MADTSGQPATQPTSYEVMALSRRTGDRDQVVKVFADPAKAAEFARFLEAGGEFSLVRVAAVTAAPSPQAEPVVTEMPNPQSAPRQSGRRRPRAGEPGWMDNRAPPRSGPAKLMYVLASVGSLGVGVALFGAALFLLTPMMGARLTFRVAIALGVIVPVGLLYLLNLLYGEE
jgi:hypothetical protein